MCCQALRASWNTNVTFGSHTSRYEQLAKVANVVVDHCADGGACVIPMRRVRRRRSGRKMGAFGGYKKRIFGGGEKSWFCGGAPNPHKHGLKGMFFTKNHEKRKSCQSCRRLALSGGGRCARPPANVWQPLGLRAGRKMHRPSDYKKSFFAAAKNPVFREFAECL